jgi:hypothetical protein
MQSFKVAAHSTATQDTTQQRLITDGDATGDAKSTLVKNSLAALPLISSGARPSKPITASKLCCCFAEVEALLGLLLAAADGRPPHGVLLPLLLTVLLLAGALVLATTGCRKSMDNG